MLYVIADKKLLKIWSRISRVFALATLSVEMVEMVGKLFITQEWGTLVSEQIKCREWLVAKLLNRGFTVRDSSSNWILLYLAESAARIV